MRFLQRIIYGQTFKKSKSERRLNKKFLIIVRLLSNIKESLLINQKAIKNYSSVLQFAIKAFQVLYRISKCLKPYMIGEDLTLTVYIYKNI